MRHIAERVSLRLAVFALIATALVWSMLANAGALNEFRDAQVLALHERAAVDAVHRFGQLPLWDPWYCGGIYGLGEPQSRFASPPFLLSLLFGVERAEPLLVFLFAILGMEGTYRWLRLRVTDATAAFRIAPIFALSGHFAVAYFRGWTNFFGFELVPFVLFGITLAARGRGVGIVVSALAFAVLIGFGGTFAAPIVAVAALVEGLRAVFEETPRNRWRAVAMLLATASFMLTVAAARLVPLAETLLAQPRIMAGTPGHLPKSLLFFLVKSLVAKMGDVEDPGSFFVGPAFLALVALGASHRKAIVPIVILTIFLWLSAGYARKPPLFALLRELPIFSALRYPERFLWVAILYACEPAAQALARLPYLGDGPGWRRGSNLALSLACAGTIAAQISMFASVGAARELGVVAMDRRDDFRQARGNRWLAAHYDGIGVGSLSCWETHPVTMSPKLRGDLAAEEYLGDPEIGTARRVSWSPNAIVVHVAMRAAGRLFVNQNWHPGWRASVGSVVSDDGLLAVDLPAGETDVRLSFRPRSAFAGGVVTAIALAALFILGLSTRRGHAPFRRGARLTTSALVAAPWAAFGWLVTTWTEPRYPPAPLNNANGLPALVAEVPTEVTKLGAQFAIPVVVDAARFSGPDARKALHFDVYLRRTGGLDRTTAMFVRIERKPGQPTMPKPEEKDRDRTKDPLDGMNADHQVVGGSFYLSDAPLGKTVHDVFGLGLGRLFHGEYDVWLAFGHVSGRRGNAGVLEAGGREVHEDKIKLGSFVMPE